MGRLSIPISDHREIRRSPEIRAECHRIAVMIKATAEQIAGEEGKPSGVGNDGYDIAEHMGTDRVRVNIWANNSTTERAEAQSAPLMQAAMQVKG